jgi:hypothetical protein
VLSTGGGRFDFQPSVCALLTHCRLVGDVQRLLIDLVMPLRLKAACDEFCAVSGSTQDIEGSFAGLVRSVRLWQGPHGYRNYWYDHSRA